MVLLMSQLRFTFPSGPDTCGLQHNLGALCAPEQWLVVFITEQGLVSFSTTEVSYAYYRVLGYFNEKKKMKTLSPTKQSEPLLTFWPLRVSLQR